MGFVPLAIVKFTVLEVPPPGLVTLTGAVPAEAMATAGMVAINCVAFPNVVARAIPPKLTTEDAIKFVPLTVSVKVAPPVKAVFGDIVVIVGVELTGGLEPLREVAEVPDAQPQTLPMIAAINVNAAILFTGGASA
jgi:hypothetical protein